MRTSGSPAKNCHFLFYRQVTRSIERAEFREGQPFVRICVFLQRFCKRTSVLVVYKNGEFRGGSHSLLCVLE